MFSYKTPEEIELAKAQLERIRKITSEWFRDEDTTKKRIYRNTQK